MTPTSELRIAVLGAGIIGSCVAAQLQRRGHRVILVDPTTPGSGASHGNAGLLSVDSCVPMATPGILRQVPGWLLADAGPLRLCPSHLPRALPWLLARIISGHMPHVLRSSDALYSLHAPALQAYRELLGQEAYARLIRVHGQVHVSSSVQTTRAHEVARILRERHGVTSHELTAAELRSEFPQLDPSIRHGRLYPHRGHTVNPRALVRAVTELFTSLGGLFLQEAALKLLPQAGRGLRIITNLGDHRFDRVVVAMGMASVRFLRPLGVRLPLQAERGYHMHLPQPGLALARPVVFSEHGFVATPMEDGLRLAGTVEIAPADAPPDERRADALLRKALELLPGLQVREASAWMGSRPSTPDSVPIIDTVDACPGLVIACGHGHFGMTAAPMTARLVDELLTGQSTGVDVTPYRLGRFAWRQSSARSAITSEASAISRSLSKAGARPSDQ